MQIKERTDSRSTSIFFIRPTAGEYYGRSANTSHRFIREKTLHTTNHVPSLVVPNPVMRVVAIRARRKHRNKQAILPSFQ